VTITRLQSISALSDDSHLATFDAADGAVEIVCRVTRDPVGLVRPEPDVLNTGRLGDPRLVAGAVLSFHHARRHAGDGKRGSDTQR
jgi:hypothetical protein